MLYAVIGDVHGCSRELNELLDLIDKQFPEACKIQVGDLVHKGPDSAGAVQTSMDRIHVQLLGNHEEKHLRWLQYEKSGKPHKMRRVEDYPKVGLTDAQEDYLINKSVLYFRDPEDALVVVHGGISQRAWLPTEPRWAALDKEARKHHKVLLYTRFQSPEGYSVMLGQETPEDVWWGNAYDGRFGTAVYGHQAYDTQEHPQEHPHALGVDLGCVYGNKLCAAIFLDGVHVDTLTVQAKATYRSHGEDTYDAT